MLVLDGSEDISATALRVLEPLKKNDISILYVRPDTDLLSKKGYMHQRVIFNVLQEYARSAVFKRIILADVATMEEYMGDVIGDLNSRRGQISGSEPRGNATVISSTVPLANMFGYVNTLRSMSQGRAQFSMHFDHYEQVPQAVSDEVRAKLA